ncbi:MAG TPA: polysaccharide deacetylase family protein [Ignavibacteria bacterium]|nr:polysaccharide deacetylase family protein [Ignavibacteria bacterium]
MLKPITIILILAVYFISLYSQDSAPQLSITIDDPNTENSGNMTWMAKDDALLEVLDKHGIKAALFVCGKRIDNAEGKVLLSRWNDEGHMICNHSYSHGYFHSIKISIEAYEKDFLRCDSLINSFSGYSRFFRYPYLKEGDSPEKRDGFREFLNDQGYRNGYVSIDASDWYIDSRAVDTLKISPDIDLTPYKEYYINHIFGRAMYYDSLAFKLTGRHIKHTLLLHHNFINALFLGELLIHFKKNGWELINASDAFSDEVYTKAPDILPAGESLIWALAKETGKFESLLRYPGEDSEYEEIPLNNFLKTYYK